METILEKKSVNETQIATFHIAKELFGIGIHRIKEIVRYPEITHVPRSPDYLKGLTNLRGNVLPVLDARVRLNLPVGEVTDRTRVLVLDVNGSLIGVIVDSVKGVASLENVRVETPPPILSSGIDSKFIRNVIYAKADEGITLELNVESLCNIDSSTKMNEHVQLQAHESVESDKKNSVAEKQLVTFLVGQEEYGFTIQSVQEILRVSKITEVPDVPNYVLGVLALRNELLPVIDIRKLFGMPSLVENKLLEIERLESNYKNWIGGFKYSVESDSEFRSIETVEALHWIESFRTSSEAIGKLLQKIRFIHQELHLHSQDLFKIKASKSVSEIKDYLDNKIQSGLDQLLLTLSDCKERVTQDIKEDQRILVADINKNSIGIMVDRMQQVIRFPESIIDPPPRIIHGDKEDNLQGIVKLDEGKRLILFLDEKKLFNEKLMSRILDVKHDNVSEKDKDVVHGGESLQEDEVQLVTFKLGKEEFGLRIADVREINRLTGVTAVPNAPSFVEGIMNLRGNVIPAIDLRKRFNLEIVKHGEATRVIIVDIMDKTTGLIVDSVSEVIRISQKLIEPPPEIISSQVETGFIDGIANLAKQGRFIIILNVNKILSNDEQRQLSAGGTK
jgi:purine-binding chemotaxis protein CheW